MNSLSKKYYGLKNISIVANGYDMIDDINDYGQDEKGFYNVCNGQLQFKGFLPKPGLKDPDDLGDPDYYFDSYEEVKQFGCKAFVVTRKYVYYDDPQSIELFNENYETSFSTFEQIFDYALSETNSEGEPYGLSYSSNVIYGAKLI